MSFTSPEDNNNMREKLINCLSEQINEFELLKSMYPNQNEIVLTDNQTIEDIQNFINHPDSVFTPNHLDFVVNISVDNLKLEICINLPSFYPEEEPDLYVRCNQLNRQEETNLNAQLLNYLKENHMGEVCLYTVISWLQENVEIFQNQVIPLHNIPDDDEEFVEKSFVRLWIYSHHIYNKKKREEIVKRARELNLNGFCLPGKPGVICIEGSDHYCQKWWRYIKSMTWKRINIRQTEVFDLSEQKKNQKFFKFEEIHFQNPSPKHNKHADMSGFSKYMEEKGLSKTFNEFFGLLSDT